MITINDCLNFKHKYEIASDAGQCPVNALPREILKHILSYLWVGLRTKEVCKGWNEYFVEVLQNDLVVWSILARVLHLPDLKSSLFANKQELMGYLHNLEMKDLQFYEWYFEHAIQSSFFENVFSVVRNSDNGFKSLIELNALDEVLADGWIRGISKEDAEKLCGKLVLRGDVEKAITIAESWPNQDLLLEIAKALPSIGHYSKSLEIAKEFEPKEKGLIYGLNATWILAVGEEETGMVLANMTPEDGPCAKTHALSGLAMNFLGEANLVKACEMMEKMEALAKEDHEEVSDVHCIYNIVLTQIAIAFQEVGNQERAIEIAEKILGESLRSHFIGSFMNGTDPLCVMM